jgi:hypothetical protein
MADLGHDDQVVGVGRERGVDQLVGRAERREVERGGVDVVDAELDRPPQHGDGLVAGRRDVGAAGAVTGQPHGAEAEPVDGQVTQRPGPGRGGGDRH